jgi:fused signal recognition particle receptor
MTPFNVFRRKKPGQDGEQPVVGERPQDGPAAEAAEEKTSGLFQRLRAGLAKTRSKVAGGLRSVLSLHRTLDESLLEEIEEQLYVADVGPKAVTRLCEGLRQAYREKQIESPDQVLDLLKAELKEELHGWDTEMHLPAEGTGVIMVAGVNGSGKTTSIAKIARMYVQQGKSVLLAASDTFRAAAAEQLEIWAGRVGADIVINQSADPAAVAFDAADKALANGYDVLIVDTAGRLHTRTNLMMELQKINRVVAGKLPGAPHETLMVLDATTGQNAVSQAIRFNDSIRLTGIVLAKLDGTAKGGVVLGMRDQIDIPVKFIGVGEGMDDLMRFDPDRFIEALFG